MLHIHVTCYIKLYVLYMLYISIKYTNFYMLESITNIYVLKTINIKKK